MCVSDEEDGVGGRDGLDIDIEGENGPCDDGDSRDDEVKVDDTLAVEGDCGPSE